MEEMKNGNSCHMCESQGCCHVCGYHQRHLVLRWLLGLLVLVIVFWIGFKLGEFKGEFMGDGFGQFGQYRMMMRQPLMMRSFQLYDGQGGNQYYGTLPAPSMMGEAQPSAALQPTITVTTGTTSSTKAAPSKTTK